MPVTREAVAEAMKKLREAIQKRNFKQSIDVAFAVKGLDPKKPESRITLDVTLPHGTGKERRVLVIADGELARLAREAGADIVIGREDLEALQGNKKEVKKLAEKFDASIAQADLMVLIGKVLGPVLGPRGKMPKPIPASANPAPIIARLRKTITLANRGQLNFQCKVGDETMPDEKLVENIIAVAEALESKLSSIGGEIRHMWLKTTMGKPIKVGVE
ncbi:MAG: 50S ribosomal protein L1 [Candidatus Hadarchaeales archaeon]